MKFNFEAFSKAIRHALIDSTYDCYSLRELAKEWNISAPTLSRVFRGKNADIDTVLTICFYLKLSIYNYTLIHSNEN